MNQLSEKVVEEKILNPDFFHHYHFPDENGNERALTLRRFIRSCVYGPDLSYPAKLEINYNGKRIYHGRLDDFCGNSSLFSIVPLRHQSISVAGAAQKVRVVIVERTVGLIFSGTVKLNAFTIQDVELEKTSIEKMELISGIFIQGKALLSTRHDTFVRGRSFTLVQPDRMK